ncbi:MAG: hypothetical protein Q4B37_08910 [Eubacteriales bacterium]|nr:hypothetical protein [Eubacteriales bacterium]
MNKLYTIENLYADSEIVAAELRIYLKGNELEKFQKQPFYAELIKYLDNIGKSENLPNIEIQNEDKKRFWNTDAKLEGDNKEVKTVKVKLHGYKKTLRQVKKIKKEMKQLNKAAKEFVELKEKLF